MRYFFFFRLFVTTTLSIFIATLTFAQQIGDKKTKVLKIVSTDYAGDAGHLVLEFDPSGIYDIGHYNEAVKKIGLYPWDFDPQSKANWQKAYAEIENDISKNIGDIKIGQKYQFTFVYKKNEYEKNEWMVSSMKKEVPLAPISVASSSFTDPRIKLYVTYVNQLISVNSNGKLYLKSFKKTDGLESEISGVKNYALDFIMEVAFVENTNLNIRRNCAANSYIDFSAGKKQYRNPKSWCDETFVGDYYNTGDVILFKRTARFIKKESGWKITNDGLYYSRTDKFHF